MNEIDYMEHAEASAEASYVRDLEQQNRDLLDALHTMVSVMQYEARISSREKELMPLCNQASELLAKVAA